MLPEDNVSAAGSEQPTWRRALWAWKEQHPITRDALAEAIGIGQGTLSKYIKADGPFDGVAVSRIETFLRNPVTDTGTLFGQENCHPLPSDIRANEEKHHDVRRDTEGVLPEDGLAKKPSDTPDVPVGQSSADDSIAELMGTSKISEDEERQEFFLPVQGFVWFYPEEVKVIDHPAFQRLQGVHQLGLAYLVFRGSCHTRFEHVLGVVKIVERMLDAITHNCRKKGQEAITFATRFLLGKEPTDVERRFVRLAGLLHDIGHLPFGHSIEDELHLLNKHDENSRLSKIFDEQNWNGHECESLSNLLDREFRPYLRRAELERLSSTEVIKSIILKRPSEGLLEEFFGRSTRQDEDKAELLDFLAANGLRINICSDIVANTICADLLDYLHRDWYHVGKPQYFEDRIMQYMEIRTPRKYANLTGDDAPSWTHEDFLVVNIGSRPRLRTDGISAILNILESRYYLAETVLFHRTKLKATGMLERALNLAFRSNTVDSLPFDKWEENGEGWNKQLESWLLSMPEDAILPTLIQDRLPKVVTNDKARRQAAKGMAARLMERQLYEEVLVVAYDQEGWTDVQRVQEVFGDSGEAPANRDATIRLLEEDFHLDLGTMAMYCPESRMNKKIARVRVLVENKVDTFENFEETNEHILSGGHLRAQLLRFKRLWRIGFYISPSVWESKSGEWRECLKDFIRVFVLGIFPAGSSYNEEVIKVVDRIARLEEFAARKLTTKSTAIAAQLSPLAAKGTYPLGTPALSTFENA